MIKATDVSPQAEVLGSFIQILAQIDSQDFFKLFQSKLSKHNLRQVESHQWYPLQNYLDAHQYVFQNSSPHALFVMGKQIGSELSFPPQVDSLKAALGELDSLYHSHHRGGNIGYYHLLKFDEAGGEAEIECRNPYPCYLDRGILTALTKRFRPEGCTMVHVDLNRHKPSRLDGAGSSFYQIFWL